MKGNMMAQATNASPERKTIYAATREDLLKRSLSNSENMDKAILSLSSAFLGASLGLMKNVVDVHRANYPQLLTASWWLFAAAIIFTLTSFLASQRAINKQLELAEKYYLKGEDSALSATNPFALATEYINWGSAIVFILAVISSIVFISINLGA